MQMFVNRVKCKEQTMFISFRKALFLLSYCVHQHILYSEGENHMWWDIKKEIVFILLCHLIFNPCDFGGQIKPLPISVISHF